MSLKFFFTFILFSPFVIASAKAITPRSNGYVSLCVSGSHARNMTNKTVRFKGVYITDLYHGAYLKDARCPKISVVRLDGAGEADVDQSVFAFDEAVSKGYPLDRSLRIFSIDISGKLSWNPGLPASIAGTRRISPHSEIIITKVWKFELISKEDGVN